jgi:hypothetical protein
MVELDLVAGDAFGVFDIGSREEYVEAWRLHRDAILPAWIASFPGSRPVAAYIDGELPPWKWRHRRHISRRMLRDDLGVQMDLNGHRTDVELQHLADIGVLDEAEIALAEARLSKPDNDLLSRYQRVAG